MKIPTDLRTLTSLKNSGPEPPPPEEFLDLPLKYVGVRYITFTGDYSKNILYYEEFGAKRAIRPRLPECG